MLNARKAMAVSPQADNDAGPMLAPGPLCQRPLTAPEWLMAAMDLLSLKQAACAKAPPAA
jgi:hypothetical protein